MIRPVTYVVTPLPHQSKTIMSSFLSAADASLAVIVLLLCSIADAFAPASARHGLDCTYGYPSTKFQHISDGTIMYASRRLDVQSAGSVWHGLDCKSYGHQSTKFQLHHTNIASKLSRREIIWGILGACVIVPSLANAANLPSNTGADLSRVVSIDTLLPIVAIQNNINSAKTQLMNSDIGPSTSVSPRICSDILQTLSKEIPREEKTFKQIFDAYSTPVSYKQKFLDQNAFLVYYTKGFDGPGRPNIEDDENSIQTLQYGTRNDAWTAVDDLFVELEFGKNSKADDNTLSTKGELVELLDKALKAVDSYLNLAPPQDLNEARRKLG